MRIRGKEVESEKRGRKRINEGCEMLKTGRKNEEDEQK